jgi:NAD(P)-dependent dehydrogenase (short-subunit alcohol dehydrogenase family)
MKYLNKLQAKRVIVFGGTSGIGFAVAEAAVEYGAIVYISGSTTQKLELCLERLHTVYRDAASERIGGYTCDLSKKDGLEASLEDLLRKVTNDGANRLDHIVFTAGDDMWGSVTEISHVWQPDDIYRLMAVRAMAPAMLAKLLPKYMHISPESSFTLTSSSGMTKPVPGLSLQLLGLGGLEAFVRGLALDMKPLRVNIVAPGVIETELLAMVPVEIKEQLKGKTTVGTFGQPEDTAEAYIYAMKDRFITGSVIHTNGGIFLM